MAWAASGHCLFWLEVTIAMVGVMVTGQEAIMVDRAATAVWRLELDWIVVRLMDTDRGEGWSLARAKRAIAGYRSLLMLLTTDPEAQLVPRTDVDVVWHYHILDTRQYARDCMKVFGHFIHHDPHAGWCQSAAWQDCYRQTETARGRLAARIATRLAAERDDRAIPSGLVYVHRYWADDEPKTCTLSLS